MPEAPPVMTAVLAAMRAGWIVMVSDLAISAEAGDKERCAATSWRAAGGGAMAQDRPRHCLTALSLA
jgi:hypothetical protein